jgi:hypothetical protein
MSEFQFRGTERLFEASSIFRLWRAFAKCVFRCRAGYPLAGGLVGQLFRWSPVVRVRLRNVGGFADFVDAVRVGAAVGFVGRLQPLFAHFHKGVERPEEFLMSGQLVTPQALAFLGIVEGQAVGQHGGLLGLAGFGLGELLLDVGDRRVNDLQERLPLLGLVVGVEQPPLATNSLAKPEVLLLAGFATDFAPRIFALLIKGPRPQYYRRDVSAGDRI